MKCFYRKSVTVNHKNGNETTTTEWLDCYGADCPAYDRQKSICLRMNFVYKDTFELVTSINTDEKE